MLKRHAQLFEGIFLASDLMVVSVAWAGSYWLRFASGLIPIEKGIPIFSDYLRMIIFVWLISAFVFKRAGLYSPMRGGRRLREAWKVIQANSLAVILLMAVTYLFREKSVPFSRLVFVIFYLSSTMLLLLARSATRSLLRTLRARGYNLRYVLIVGAGSLAEKVSRNFARHPEYGFKLVGFLAGENPNPYCKSRIVGAYEDLAKFIDEGQVDRIVFALPLADNQRLEELLSEIEDSMIDVKIVPDFHHFIKLGSLIEDFDGMPVVSVASTPLSGVNRVVKRVVDVALGSVLFVVTLPVMLIIALLIKLTSRGPIFFTQERVGLDGRMFNIYKFRTMRLDAEVNGACFAVPGDPRVTTLGYILRRTSLDELPQLVNVIRGHMSLVGPRPERPVFISEFKKHVPKYMFRHKVQAGMTGWAQVNGWRGNTSIERRIEHDLYYIEHWSLGLDLKILGLTLVNGFRNRNAY